MNDDYELLDVVDASDKVTGTIKRGDTRILFASSAGYLRYSCCFLQNSEGKLWIPTRTASKKIAPNGLDFSASEHVQSGESYLDAMVRGLREELNLQAVEGDFRFIGKIPPDDDRRSFSSIYIVKGDAVPDFNKDDFIGYEWLTPSELLRRLNAGADAKYDLKPAVELLVVRGKM